MNGIATLLTAVALAASGSMGHAAQACCAVGHLKAHDINGIALDMTPAQVRALGPSSWEVLPGGNVVNTTIGGRTYQIEFTPLGHASRIEMHQVFGVFRPTEAFTDPIRVQITQKYGPIRTFYEPFRAGGATLWRETEGVDGLVLGTGNGPVTFDLKLMSFAIMRRDGSAVNAGPEAKARKQLSF